jgi:hypothetical protein
VSDLTKISRLEKQLTVAEKGKQAILTKIRDLQKELKTEKTSSLLRLIIETGFPLEQEALLIGAILHAKDELAGPNKTNVINHYTELYQVFCQNKKKGR